MRLAIDDLALLQLCRLQHEEQGFTVGLDLGSLAGFARVFDGKLMETELFLNPQQQRVIRLLQG